MDVKKVRNIAQTMGAETDGISDEFLSNLGTRVERDLYPKVKTQISKDTPLPKSFES
jgi:hypothetical protein